MSVQTKLSVSTAIYREVRGHLLPEVPEAEEVAFLFARRSASAEGLTLEVIDHHLVRAAEYDRQGMAHLQIGNEVLGRMIKKAHDLEAALVEAHSHPYDYAGAACFSWSDRAGLADLVPHILWRLPGRPYLALVFAPEGFDALIWHADPKAPAALDALLVGNELLTPTSHTLPRWRKNEPL